jgi:hypothetical protein
MASTPSGNGTGVAVGRVVFVGGGDVCVGTVGIGVSVDVRVGWMVGVCVLVELASISFVGVAVFEIEWFIGSGDWHPTMSAAIADRKTRLIQIENIFDFIDSLLHQTQHSEIPPSV